MSTQGGGEELTSVSTLSAAMSCGCTQPAAGGVGASGAGWQRSGRNDPIGMDRLSDHGSVGLRSGPPELSGPHHHIGVEIIRNDLGHLAVLEAKCLCERATHRRFPRQEQVNQYHDPVAAGRDLMQL